MSTEFYKCIEEWAERCAALQRELAEVVKERDTWKGWCEETPSADAMRQIDMLKLLLAERDRRIERLEQALRKIADMQQDDLKGKLKSGDMLKIIGALSKLFNDCRDIAQAALAPEEGNK